MRLAALTAVLALSATADAADAPPGPSTAPVPRGSYPVDKAHTSILFRVNHLGFSAQGVLQRSAFGIANGLPAPGSTFGVADDVEVQIETEFSGPPLAGAAAH